MNQHSASPFASQCDTLPFPAELRLKIYGYLLPSVSDSLNNLNVRLLSRRTKEEFDAEAIKDVRKHVGELSTTFPNLGIRTQDCSSFGETQVLSFQTDMDAFPYPEACVTMYEGLFYHLIPHFRVLRVEVYMDESLPVQPPPGLSREAHRAWQLEEFLFWLRRMFDRHIENQYILRILNAILRISVWTPSCKPSLSTMGAMSKTRTDPYSCHFWWERVVRDGTQTKLLYEVDYEATEWLADLCPEGMSNA